MNRPEPSTTIADAREAEQFRALLESTGSGGFNPFGQLDSAVSAVFGSLDLERVTLWTLGVDGVPVPRLHLPRERAPIRLEPLPETPFGVVMEGGSRLGVHLPIGAVERAILIGDRRDGRSWSPGDALLFLAVAQSVSHLLTRDGSVASLSPRDLEELASLGSWSWEIASNEVTWSDNLHRMVGIAPGSEGLSYERFIQFVAPEDREAVVSVIEAALRGERPYEFQARTIAPDGAQGWILCRAIVERGTDGQPTRVAGTVQDISELRRTQEALRSSEARFRGLFMEFPFSVQIFDPEGRTLQVNRAFETFWGYGMEALGAFNPLTEPQLEPIRHLLRRGFSGETVFLPPVLFDGSRIAATSQAPGARWVQAFLFPVRDSAGKLREVILVHQDITQQKQAEEQLKVSEESYRTIFDLASDGIFVHDPVSGAVLDVNRQACEIHGLSFEELRARGLDAIAPLGDSAARERAIEFIHRAAAGEPQRFEWLVDRSPEPVWVEVSLNRVSILGEDRVLANVRNVHERKSAEAALRKAYEELETRVAERTAELRAANEALSRSVAEHEKAREELVRRTEEMEGIFQALPDLYFRLSDDGRIIQHRSGSGQGLYLPPEQFLGKRITDVMPPDVGALLQRGFEEVAATGRLAIVEYALVDGGTTLEYEARILPLPDGTLISIVRDITGRKRAERALQQREEHFRRLIENAHDLVQVLDHSGLVTYTGPSVEHLLGYEAEELVGRRALEFIHPEDVGTIETTLQEIFATPGSVHSAQYRVMHSDGDWRVFEAFGRTIVAESGEIGVVVNARDVTERRKIEEALRNSEEHFRRLIENAHDMVVIMDARGTFEYGSPSVQRILGYDPEGIRGLDSAAYIHPDDTASVGRQLGAMAANPQTPARIECRFRHKDGSWRHLEAIGSPLSPGSPDTGFVFNVRDATERHEAEDALREREEHFRTLIENAHDITCICDPDGRMLYQSPSFQRRLGYTPEDLIGKIGFPYIHPEDVPVAMAALGRMVASPGSVARVEYRFRHKDGSWRMLEAFGRTLLPGSAGAGIVLNIRDVTERMLSERALEQAKEEAEQAREAAERANRAKSEFLSRMSHELRTPMNSILGFAQLLDRGDLPADQRRGVQHILKAGRHLLQLINEVLEIARIEAGRQNFSLEPVRVRGIIQEAVGLVRPLAAQRKVELEDGPWAHSETFVSADRQRLVQVLLNLLSNAVKYNRPGGRVRVVCSAPEAGRIAIRVEDTGRGIPEERRDQLFTPFARLGAEQTEVEGTGLGLALSQRLTEAMSGSLALERSSGEGSVFRLELVLAADPVVAIEEQKATQPARPTNHVEATLLYIEDNLANLSLVESILEGRPRIRTLPSLQGQLGVELAREHRPDLILLDLHLPDISGQEVLRRLRADPRTRPIPVVIVSADATRDARSRLEAAGADGYLTKPLDVEVFLDTIDRFVQGKGI
jgi:PAS domain S-box-containing protein